MAKKEIVELIDDKLCVGITRLVAFANLLHMSEINEPHKVTELIKLGLPSKLKGKERIFPLEDVFAWYAKNCLETDELKNVKLQHEIDRLQAQTQKINFDYQVAKKEFVSVKEVSQSQAELIAFLKTQDKNFLKQIPDKKTREIIDKYFKEKWIQTGDELEKLKDNKLDSN